MKEFDYIIIGGGCAGLSLAYELDINQKLKDKTLAIIEPRDEYKKDKTWSFWRVTPHNFEDCIKKSWGNFTINIPNNTKHVECSNTPYQTIDSGLFYKKIINKLKQNININFFKSIREINTENSFVFNSVSNLEESKNNLWQHFSGIEIETSKDFFDDEIFNLMDFECDQKDSVHFFYTLPFSKTKALIETTWISDLNNNSLKDYDKQLKDYIENKLKIKNYKINFKETGAIPLFHPKNIKKFNQMEIGTAGFTAMLCLMSIENHGIKPSDGKVLVTGATGGVGSLSVALLHASGYEIIASTGKENQDKYLKSLGASQIIHRAELSAQHKPLDRQKWAAAIDTVGSTTLANICATTRSNGAVAACGMAQGMDLPTTVAPFILRGITLYGINSVNVPLDKRKIAWRRLSADLDNAKLGLISNCYKIDEVPKIAQKILRGEITGRCVVDVNS